MPKPFRPATSAILALASLALASPSLLRATPCIAKVSILVDLSAQTMDVETPSGSHHWRVSSGRRGFETPDGTFGVSWMDRDHRSAKYDDAPMPDAIFFTGGFAIHGASRSAFGHPASHGCVRLPLEEARTLFDAVAADGPRSTSIRIVGSAANPSRLVASSDRSSRAEDGNVPRRDRFVPTDVRDSDDVPTPSRRVRPAEEPLWPGDE